jgi:hypothetical protein
MFKSKLLVIVIVLAIGSSLLMAYTSRGRDASSAEKPAGAQAPEVVTSGDSSHLLSNTSANRRWSGEVFLSGNDAPDLVQQTRESSKQNVEPACMSLNDGQSARRYGGCVE